MKTNKQYIKPLIDIIEINSDEIITSSGNPIVKSVESGLFGDDNHGVFVG